MRAQTRQNVFQGANFQKSKKNLKNPQNFKTFAIFLDFQQAFKPLLQFPLKTRFHGTV